MKTLKEIEIARSNTDKTSYHGMTYEEGIANALDWVSGEIPDEDFEYSKIINNLDDVL